MIGLRFGRNFLVATLGALLPPLLMLLHFPETVAWRIASGARALILGSWAVTFPRRRKAA